MKIKTYQNLNGNTSFSSWSNLVIKTLTISYLNDENDFLVLDKNNNSLDFEFLINCPNFSTGNNKKIKRIQIRFNEGDILNYEVNYAPKNIFTTEVTGTFSTKTVYSTSAAGNLSISFYDGDDDLIGSYVSDISTYGQKKIFIQSQSFQIINGRKLEGNIILKYDRDIKNIYIRKTQTQTSLVGELKKDSQNNKKYNLTDSSISEEELDQNNFIGLLNLEYNCDNLFDYWLQINPLYRIYDLYNNIQDYGIKYDGRIVYQGYWINTDSIPACYLNNGQSRVKNYFTYKNSTVPIEFDITGQFLEIKDNNIIVARILISELEENFNFLNFCPPILKSNIDIEQLVNVDYTPIENVFTHANNVYYYFGNSSRFELFEEYEYFEFNNFHVKIDSIIYDQVSVRNSLESFVKDYSYIHNSDSSMGGEKDVFAFPYEDLYRKNLQFFIKIWKGEAENLCIEYELTNLLQKNENNLNAYKYIIPVKIKEPQIYNGLVEKKNDDYILSFDFSYELVKTKFLEYEQIVNYLYDFEKQYTLNSYTCYLFTKYDIEIQNNFYQCFLGEYPLSDLHILEEITGTSLKIKLDNINNIPDNTLDDKTILIKLSKNINISGIRAFIEGYKCISKVNENISLTNGHISPRLDNYFLNLDYEFQEGAPTVVYLPNQLGINSKPNNADILKIEKVDTPDRISIGNGIKIYINNIEFNPSDYLTSSNISATIDINYILNLLTAQDIVNLLNSENVMFSGGTWNISS